MHHTEHVTLTRLITEVVILNIGYQVQHTVDVEVECHTSYDSNRPSRVVLLNEVTLRFQAIEVQLPSGYDATEIVDMAAVAQLVREARAARELAELDALDAGGRVPKFV